MLKISIIIPVYNASQFIGETIKSVQKQTYQDWSLILIDDSSTDNSLEVLQSYKKGDGRITILSTEYNSGPACARNLGIDYAIKNGADYLAFIDSDDLYAPQFLDIMLQSIKEQSADIVWCNYYEYPIGQSDNKTLVRHGFSNKLLSPQEGISLFLKQTKGIGSLWNKLYSSSFIEKNNIRLNENRVRAEDWEFNLMLFDQSAKVYAISDVLYNYVHQNRISVMGTFREKDFEMYKRSLHLLEDIAKKWHLEGYVGSIYTNFVYNSICYLVLAIAFKHPTSVVNTALKDLTFQTALSKPNVFSCLTKKHKLYAFLVKFKAYCILKILIKKFH